MNPEKAAQRAIFMATLAFAANFSVWTLYAVLGLELRSRLDLSMTEYGLLMAAPMLTGALLRFPAGILSERYSGYWLYVGQMLFLIPFLFLLPLARTFNDYLLFGFALGVSGVSFTVGIRYISNWFTRDRQGFAMGVFGSGNAGAAITLVLAPIISQQLGWQWVGPAFGGGMILMIVLFMLFAPRDAAIPASQSTGSDFHILKSLRIWRFGLYYYFVFGSFLALLMWLPHYFTRAYGLDNQGAFLLTLLFVGISSSVRALGGWFADRYGGRSVNWWVFWVCLVCLFFLSYPPTQMSIQGVERVVHLKLEISVGVFTVLLLVIGIAQGFGRASVYKTLHEYYPNHMGLVGGTVAACGAAGGFSLPVFFGLAVDWLGIHSASFMVLYGVLALCMAAMYFAIEHDRFEARVKAAVADNFLDAQ